MTALYSAQSPLYLELQLNGNYTLRLQPPLAKGVASSLADTQTCAALKRLGIGKRGPFGVTAKGPLPPVCEGTICIVVNAALAMRAASKIAQYINLWDHVSPKPPTMLSNLDPAVNYLKQIAVEEKLFPLPNSNPTTRDGIFGTIAFTFLGAEFEVHDQPDANLTNGNIDFSKYACSAQGTSSTSICPQMTVTFTSPVRTASTYVSMITFALTYSMIDMVTESAVRYHAMQLESHKNRYSIHQSSM